MAGKGVSKAPHVNLNVCGVELQAAGRLRAEQLFAEVAPEGEQSLAEAVARPRGIAFRPEEGQQLVARDRPRRGSGDQSKERQRASPRGGNGGAAVGGR